VEFGIIYNLQQFK